MIKFFLVKILMVNAIAQPAPTCSSEEAPKTIEKCQITSEGGANTELGRSCVIFNSGLIILTRCDNTKCSLKKGVAKSYLKNYCTTTKPSGPTVSGLKIIDYKDIKKFLSSPESKINFDCQTPGLESVRHLSEEIIGAKQLKAVPDTEDFQLFNESIKLLAALTKSPEGKCASMALSRYGIGPVIFFNKTAEKILSPAIGAKHLADQPYAPCFQ